MKITLEEIEYELEQYEPKEGDRCVGYEDELNYSIGLCTREIKETGAFIIEGRFYFDHDCYRILSERAK